jgi:hypothetical protein
MTRTRRGGITAREFFALGIAGATPHAASRALDLPLSMVQGIAKGSVAKPNVAALRALARWSRELPEAKRRAVWISTIATLAIRPEEM